MSLLGITRLALKIDASGYTVRGSMSMTNQLTTTVIMRSLMASKDQDQTIMSGYLLLLLKETNVLEYFPFLGCLPISKHYG